MEDKKPNNQKSSTRKASSSNKNEIPNTNTSESNSTPDEKESEAKIKKSKLHDQLRETVKEINPMFAAKIATLIMDSLGETVAEELLQDNEKLTRKVDQLSLLLE